MNKPRYRWDGPLKDFYTDRQIAEAVLELDGEVFEELLFRIEDMAEHGDGRAIRVLALIYASDHYKAFKELLEAMDAPYPIEPTHEENYD